MANSNVSSIVQESKVKVDNNNKPASNTAETASSNVPSTPEKQEDNSNTVNNNANLTEQKQEISMENSSISALDKEKIIGTATSEMEYRVELFNRLTNTCFHKCTDKRYKEGELNIGENSCIDRCVSKYTQVNNIIGHVLAYGRRNV